MCESVRTDGDLCVREGGRAARRPERSERKHHLKGAEDRTKAREPSCQEQSSEALLTAPSLNARE